MTTEDKLRMFLVDELQCGRGDELTTDFPLLDEQVIDSMGIFQVVTFVESAFGVQVRDEELVAENFATIGDIARLVESKQAAKP